MRLLCVEPSEGVIARSFGETLRELAELSYTTSYQDALDLVRARRIDLVLLPHTPGPESLLMRIRALAPRLPIIAFGEADTALAAAQAASQGALGYVVQPNNGVLDPSHLSVLTDLVRRAGARLRVEQDRLTTLEESLRIRKFYGDVLTSVGQGIVVIDHQGKFRFRNPQAARILGESDEEAGLQGETAVPILQMLVESLSEGETRHGNIVLEDQDQRVFLDVTTSVLRSTDGKATGAVAIVSDKSIEKSLEQQLMHSERLATLGSLLASIAHEINNTLTSITGCAEMGLELAESAEQAAGDAKDPVAKETLSGLAVEIRQIFDLVLEAGISCQTIADNMLQYSRRRKPAQRLKQDLNQIVTKTLKVLGKHLGVEKVALHLELDSNTPRVRIDPAKLQQSLVNLSVNAVHALLDMEDLPLEQKILRVSTRKDPESKEAILTVADEGPGIPPRRLEKIFQPFFTTKDHGTGLGLYITRRVIEEEEGSISVESEVGKGTTFSIRLPLA